jgi:hypothetical protein
MSIGVLMLQAYNDNGIRFEYPGNWELEVTEDGPRTTVTVNAPSGLAFAMVTLDTSGEVVPTDLADEALGALRDEYPGLEASPVKEVIDGHEAVGHDVEFISLDLVNSSTIRCFNTPRRSILYFAQWSDLTDDTDPEAELKELRQSLEETDA